MQSSHRLRPAMALVRVLLAPTPVRRRPAMALGNASVRHCRFRLSPKVRNFFHPKDQRKICFPGLEKDNFRGQTPKSDSDLDK
jgi:hypothetical protein